VTALPRLVAVGISYRTAPVSVREKASLGEAAARAALRSLRARDDVLEALVLSTCSRTELYAVAGDAGALEAAIVEHARIGADELREARYVLEDERAAAQLMSVAAGLDAMVVGESEIRAQVRDAGELAAEEFALGPVLRGLVRHALVCGRRIRRETRIGAGPVSLSSVAVDAARRSVGDLHGRRVVVLGAGRMAGALAGALRGHGAGDLVVLSRSGDSARALAQRAGGRGTDMAALEEELRGADVVIAATSAPDAVVRAGDVERAMRGRDEARPLLLIDLAVPRDIEPATAAIAGVTVHDLDDLERVVQVNLGRRRREAERAEAIVSEELERFAAWRSSLAAEPAVALLHARADAIRRAELDRLRARSPQLAEAHGEALDALTRSLVRKLLHEPSVRLRGGGDGLRHLDSLRHLFALEDAVQPPASTTS
jgi:glutamyl-tRNA reductase